MRTSPAPVKSQLADRQPGGGTRTGGRYSRGAFSGNARAWPAPDAYKRALAEILQGLAPRGSLAPGKASAELEFGAPT